MNRFRHVAVIPARKGSRGIPGKNPALFGLTATLIGEAGFFDRVVVTSDDEALLDRARAEKFEIRRRPVALAAVGYDGGFVLQAARQKDDIAAAQDYLGFVRAFFDRLPASQC